jgi:hypothetical protein
MRSLLLLSLSLRAIGKLVGIGVLCLLALVVVGIVAGPGFAVLGLVVLIVLVRAVVKAVRS